MTVEASSSATCANCGATLAGGYCAACGQSRDALNQSIFALAFDWLGDVFAWDGRLSRTLRGLYARPGRVAHDYVEGRRVAFTPPIRMFLLASLVLIATIAALDMRLVSIRATGVFAPTGEEPRAPEDMPVGVQLGISGDVEGGIAYLTLTTNILDRSRSTQRPLDPDLVARVVQSAEADPEMAFLTTAVTDPEGVEDAVNAAATQALFTIVAVFALLNLLIHPRRRVIHHLVHAFYFHAAVALALAPLVGMFALDIIPRPILAWPAVALFVVGMILFDRGAYGTSALGLLWRIPVLFAGYCVGLGLVQIAFTFLMVLR